MKELFKKLAIGGLFVFLIWLKSYLVITISYNEERIPFAFSNVSIILTAIVIFMWVATCFRKRFVFILFALYILYSFILFSNLIYYRYFGDFWSLFIFYYIGQLKDVSGSLSTLIRLSDLWLFLDVLLVTVLYFGFWRNYEWVAVKSSTAIKIAQITLLLMFTCFVIGHSVVASIEQPFEKRNANRHVVSKVGFIDFYVRDAYYFIRHALHSNDVSEQELVAIKKSFRDKESIGKGEHFGDLKGQNIIYLQLESMSSYVINRKVNGQEITPNLNKLLKEHYSVPSFYKQNGGGHTSDAEYLSLTSQYPLEHASVSVMYGDNSFYTMAHILQKNGYSTVSAHGYKEDFWNRNHSHKSYGFQQSWFEDDYEVENEDWSLIGIKDAPFYEETVKKLAKMKKPFFAHLISVECHTPFYVSEEDKNLELGDLEGTVLGSYYQSANVSDKAVGHLLDKLDEAGLKNNTTLVIFGDHDAELHPDDLTEIIGDTIESHEPINTTKVPFMVVTPSHSLKGEYTNVMGHIDIAPSVLHLTGIVPKEAYFYGRNIFDPSTTNAIRLPSGSVMTKDFYFYTDDGLVENGNSVNMKTGKETNDIGDFKQLYHQFEKENMYSKMIIEGDLLPLLRDE